MSIDRTGQKLWSSGYHQPIRAPARIGISDATNSNFYQPTRRNRPLG